MKLTRERRIAGLVRRGIMPSTAERIVSDVDTDNGQLLFPGAAAALAIITDADIEQVKHWWYYNPDVPLAIKRILDARQIDNA